MAMKLDDLIKELEKKLIVMMDMTSEIVNNAMNYYFQHDENFLKLVDETEDTINQYENDIDEQAIRIFALQQPFAFDLRKAVMSIKMNTDLERIGDLAYNIAHRAHGSIVNNYYNADKTETKSHYFVTNINIINQMLIMVKRSFLEGNVDLANKVLEMDHEVDINNSTVFRECIKTAIANPDKMNFYLNHINISKSMERIADHCTNIAQDLIYVFTGVNVKHQAKREV